MAYDKIYSIVQFYNMGLELRSVAIKKIAVICGVQYGTAEKILDRLSNK